MSPILFRWSGYGLVGFVLPIVLIVATIVLVGLNAKVGTFDPGFIRPVTMSADTTILSANNRAGTIRVNAYG